MASIHTETNKRGRSYRVKWRDDDGGQRTRTFRLRSDAQLFRAQVETGTVAEPARRTDDLRSVLEEYQTTRRASRSTLAKETSLARRLEPLADRPVGELRASDVRAWVADLVDDGLSAETVSACLRLLRSVLDRAVEDDQVAANVAARVKPPKIVKPPLDADDVLTVLEFEAVLERIPDRWRALFALRAYTGPRLSEALGMRREDIDLLRRRVHVGHRVLEEVSGDAQMREGGKTGRGSDRWLPLPDRVVELLEHHLSTYSPGRDGSVFTTSDGGLVHRDNLRRRVWEPAVRGATTNDCAHCGEPSPSTPPPAECAACRKAWKSKPVTVVTMRNLRHTAASWMYAAGLEPLEVAYRLGHSKPSTSLDTYARFRPRAEDQVDPYADVFRRNIGGTP